MDRTKARDVGEGDEEKGDIGWPGW